VKKVEWPSVFELLILSRDCDFLWVVRVLVVVEAKRNEHWFAGGLPMTVIESKICGGSMFLDRLNLPHPFHFRPTVVDKLIPRERYVVAKG